MLHSLIRPGTAIDDATKALAADPTYHKVSPPCCSMEGTNDKAYFRRATANMGIVKPKLALRDFKILAAKEPGNRDAATKLAECEKIIRRIQFEKAIETESPPSSWEGLDPDDLGISESAFESISNVVKWLKSRTMGLS